MAFNIDILEKELYEKIGEKQKKAAESLIKNHKAIISEATYLERLKAVRIQGRVIENGYPYYVNLLVSSKNKIQESSCQCTGYDDILKNFRKIRVCEHSAALLMMYISEVREMHEKERIDYENMGKNLIKDLDDLSMPKEKVRLEVNISKYNSKDFYEVSFKIGNKKTYVLKSIEEFIKAREELEDLVYGKGFTYSPVNNFFDETDEAICDYMEECIENNQYIGGGYRKELVKGKFLYVSHSGLRRFLKIVKDKEITLNEVKHNVVEEDIPLNFELKQKENKYNLNMFDIEITILTPKMDAVIYNQKIYLPSKKTNESNEHIL